MSGEPRRAMHNLTGTPKWQKVFYLLGPVHICGKFIIRFGIGKYPDTQADLAI